jgi:hypothetical protein
MAVERCADLDSEAAITVVDDPADQPAAPDDSQCGAGPPFLAAHVRMRDLTIAPTSASAPMRIEPTMIGCGCEIMAEQWPSGRAAHRKQTFHGTSLPLDLRRRFATSQARDDLSAHQTDGGAL